MNSYLKIRKNQGQWAVKSVWSTSRDMRIRWLQMSHVARSSEGQQTLVNRVNGSGALGSSDPNEKRADPQVF